MTMTRAQALDYVNQQNPTFLTPAADTSLRNGRPMFKCPCCPHGSGKGSGGDGICIIPESVRTGHPRWKCFSCGMVEDVAGLWTKVHPGDNNFSQLYQYFNLDVEIEILIQLREVVIARVNLCPESCDVFNHAARKAFPTGVTGPDALGNDANSVAAGTLAGTMRTTRALKHRSAVAQ